jgi:putative colanic acid biosynthesis acetyltransferase WcaF
MARITIGSKVAISQRSFVRRHPRHPQFATPLVTREIVIKDHVWVAAESFIHPGCVVGEAVWWARARGHSDFAGLDDLRRCSRRPIKPRDIAQ